MDLLSNAQAGAVARLKALLNSKDEKAVAAVRASNQDLLNCKLLTPGAVHQNATLSSLSIQYKNEDLIGTKLMPYVRVAKLSDIYYIYDKRNRAAVPDDKIGARARAAEINESRSTATYSCQPYALQNYVDESTLQNQDAPLNEMVDLVASVNDVMDLAEEIRIATILCATGNFGSNYTALSGSDRWDSSAGGNPIKNIQDGLASCWTGFGPGAFYGYCSLGVWNVLSRHPMILDLFKYNSSGLAATKQVAAFFGLEDILVGKARKDAANEGASVSYSRVWSDVFGIVRVASSPSVRNAAFGYSFRHLDKVTTQWFDASVGMSGGYYAKVGQAEDHKVVASDTGYLFSTVIG